MYSGAHYFDVSAAQGSAGGTVDFDTYFRINIEGVKVFGDIVLTEQADHAFTPAAGIGAIWLRNDAPTTLMYTDDAGTDYPLSSPTTDTTDDRVTQDQTTKGYLINRRKTPSTDIRVRAYKTVVARYVPVANRTPVAITVTIDRGDGTVGFGAASNGYAVGETVLISGTTHNDFQYTITAVDTNTFDVVGLYISSTGTGSSNILDVRTSVITGYTNNNRRTYGTKEI